MKGCKKRNMIRTGFVKEKKKDTLKVCFERPEACEGCRGCAKGILPKKELLTVFGQADVGDMVDVRMPEAQTLKASLMAYAVPLCTLLLGLAAASLLKVSDAVTFLLALLGGGAGVLIARAFERKLRGNSQWRPEVVFVHPRDEIERK